MPKLLVLFEADSDDIARMADAVADGARRVRFAEVDVRRVAGTESATRARYKPLESADALAEYDGILLGAHGGEEDGVHGVLTTPASLVNKVGSVFTAAPGPARRGILLTALAPMADRGMILVPPPLGTVDGDELELARALGQRVAEVVGWVTHARSHHHHH
jgi:NAD(P)H dehydrogenase (quinone)